MKKIRVYGKIYAHVSTVVEVEDDFEVNEDSMEELIDLANDQFGGVSGYCGNGGYDKLIGVSGSNDTIEDSGEVEFASNGLDDICEE